MCYVAKIQACECCIFLQSFYQCSVSNSSNCIVSISVLFLVHLFVCLRLMSSCVSVVFEMKICASIFAPSSSILELSPNLSFVTFLSSLRNFLTVSNPPFPMISPIKWIKGLRSVYVVFIFLIYYSNPEAVDFPLNFDWLCLS